MTTSRNFILSLAMAMTLPAGAVDFIRQIQLIEGQTVVYDLPVHDLSGQKLSKPLEGDGALFQLYAYPDDAYNPFSLLDLNAGENVHANVSLGSHLVDVDLLGIHLDVILGGTGTPEPLPQLLDELVVGPHLPDVTLKLRSEDPYSPPRIRADQPFTMDLAVRKLAEPEDPRGGISKITVTRDFKFYHPDLHLPYPDGSGQGGYDSAYEFTRNGDFSAPGILQALPAQRPTKAIGEETFTARVPLGNGGREATVASSTIQIWPVCDGTIEGIDAGKRYTGVPPEARIRCNDLYPDSVTYAQIYKGKPALGSSGQIIGSSVISFNTYEPQDAVLPLSMSDDDTKEDGIYTIEVLTVTPFNDRRPERIAHVTFEIDRIIKVRSTLVSGED